MFANTLATSRLSHANYNRLKQTLKPIMCRFYDQVIISREAPEKPDHGDVDFLVQDPKPHTSFAALQQALNAPSALASTPTMYFAVPLPDPSPIQEYAQVDVHVCPGTIAWLSFRNSYGVTWQILGNVVRPLGLTPNDVGLFLRIEEGESRNRKDSMVFLTSDPRSVLEFLGLSWSAWERDFETVDELYAWICTCRLFTPDVDQSADFNTSDRRALRRRALVTRFYEEYLPATMPPPGSSPLPDRDTVLREAVAFFGCWEAYEAKVVGIRERQDDVCATKLVAALVRGIPGTSVTAPNLVARAVRRWVLFEVEGPVIREQAEMRTEEQPMLGVMLDEGREKLRPEMERWLLEHWEGLKGRERERVKAAKEARVEGGEVREGIDE